MIFAYPTLSTLTPGSPQSTRQWPHRVKRPVLEADHSLPFNADVKNDKTATASANVFMAQTLINLCLARTSSESGIDHRSYTISLHTTKLKRLTIFVTE
jgi:hypothetical protein